MTETQANERSDPVTTDTEAWLDSVHDSCSGTCKGLAEWERELLSGGGIRADVRAGLERSLAAQGLRPGLEQSITSLQRLQRLTARRNAVRLDLVTEALANVERVANEALAAGLQAQRLSVPLF